MKCTDNKPHSVTITALISVCSQLLDLHGGQELHCNAIKRCLYTNLFVNNALLGMYSKCDLFEDVLQVFNEMEVHDAVSWTSINFGCVLNGNYEQAFKLLTYMKVEGVKMDIATMLSILPACSFFAAKRQAKEVHGCILKFGLEQEVPVGNALIEMYLKCGILDYVVHVFEFMNSYDVVTWTTLMYAYGMYDQGEMALTAFKRLEESGIVPDHVGFVALFYACSHARLVGQGKAYFDRMEKEYKIVPRMEHYACMVDIFARQGHLVEAEKIIMEMPMEPDASKWGTLLSACRVFISNRNNLAPSLTFFLDKNFSFFGSYCLRFQINNENGQIKVILLLK